MAISDNINGLLQKKVNRLNNIKVSNPNLLINGNFQVNQSGKTSWSKNGLIYTFDGWVLHKGVASVTSEGQLQLNSNIDYPDGESNNEVYQFIDRDLQEGIYTLSYRINGINQIFQVNISKNMELQRVHHNTYQIFMFYDQNRNCYVLCIRVKYNQVIKIDWVKLEQGSVATPFIPKSYAEELRDCQWYYSIGEFTGVSMFFDDEGNTNNGYMFAFSVPQMRINTPTPTFIRGKYYVGGKLKTINNPTSWWYMDETQDHTNSASVCLYVYLKEGTKDTVCAGASIVAELDARIY